MKFDTYFLNTSQSDKYFILSVYHSGIAYVKVFLEKVSKHKEKKQEMGYFSFVLYLEEKYFGVIYGYI